MAVVPAQQSAVSTALRNSHNASVGLPKSSGRQASSVRSLCRSLVPGMNANSAILLTTLPRLGLLKPGAAAASHGLPPPRANRLSQLGSLGLTERAASFHWRWRTQPSPATLGLRLRIRDLSYDLIFLTVNHPPALPNQPNRPSDVVYKVLQALLQCLAIRRPESLLTRSRIIVAVVVVLFAVRLRGRYDWPLGTCSASPRFASSYMCGPEAENGAVRNCLANRSRPQSKFSMSSRL